MKEGMDVRSIMASPVVTVLFNEPVHTAVERMLAHDIGAVIVVSGGLPAGIVTERDIMSAVVSAGKDPRKVLTSEIMSKPLITIHPEAPITEAIALMKDKDIRRVAVVKDDKLVGIVTEKEILRRLF